MKHRKLETLRGVKLLNGLGGDWASWTVGKYQEKRYRNRSVNMTCSGQNRVWQVLKAYKTISGNTLEKAESSLMD